MNQFRFHLLGLAHIPTRREFQSCAYTQKVVKLAMMLKSLGHYVTCYGGEGSDVDCDEFVQVLSNAERIACYGEYDWKAEFFKHDPADAAHQAFNRNAIAAILERAQQRDFLLCPMGNYDKPIADAVGLMTVESGIGYEGIFAKFKVFESHYWQAHVYGLTGQRNGNFYDDVIWNYFDPDDFPHGMHKGDYFLFMGRLISRKGLDIAVQVTRHLGVKLIVAGQGSLVNPAENLKCDEPHVTHIGTVDATQRAELMGNAIATFAPTLYLEPFGGVAAESQLAGTPTIATDWGSFPEIVEQDITGWRCHTFQEFINASKRAVAHHGSSEWHNRIRALAVQRFSMDTAKLKYQAYFDRLSDLWRNGWYELNE